MLSKNETEIIRSTFLFSGADDGFINDFVSSSACTLTDVEKGETVWGAPEDKNRLGILLSGRVCAVGVGGSASLKTFEAGELFGAATVFCDKTGSPFSIIRAKTRARVLLIRREAVEKHLSLNPDKALAYISFLSGRVEFLNRRISTFTSKEAVTRLAKYLFDTADETGVCKRVNFSALVRILDVSRASLYRARAELIEKKLILAEGHTVTLLDPAALKNII